MQDNILESTIFENYDTIIFDLDGTLWDCFTQKSESIGAWQTTAPYTLVEKNLLVDIEGNIIRLQKDVDILLSALFDKEKNLGIVSSGEKLTDLRSKIGLPPQAQPSTMILKKFEIYKYFNYDIILKSFINKEDYVRPLGKTLFIDDRRDILEAVKAKGLVDVLWRGYFNDWGQLLNLDFSTASKFSFQRKEDYIKGEKGNNSNSFYYDENNELRSFYSPDINYSGGNKKYQVNDNLINKLDRRFTQEDFEDYKQEHNITSFKLNRQSEDIIETKLDILNSLIKPITYTSFGTVKNGIYLKDIEVTWPTLFYLLTRSPVPEIPIFSDVAGQKYVTFDFLQKFVELYELYLRDNRFSSLKIGSIITHKLTNESFFVLGLHNSPVHKTRYMKVANLVDTAGKFANLRNEFEIWDYKEEDYIIQNSNQTYFDQTPSETLIPEDVNFTTPLSDSKLRRTNPKMFDRRIDWYSGDEVEYSNRTNNDIQVTSSIDLPKGEQYSDYMNTYDIQPKEIIKNSPSRKEDDASPVRQKLEFDKEKLLMEKGLHQDFNNVNVMRPITPYASKPIFQQDVDDYVKEKIDSESVIHKYDNQKRLYNLYSPKSIYRHTDKNFESCEKLDRLTTSKLSFEIFADPLTYTDGSDIDESFETKHPFTHVEQFEKPKDEYPGEDSSYNFPVTEIYQPFVTYKKEKVAVLPFQQDDSDNDNLPDSNSLFLSSIPKLNSEHISFINSTGKLPFSFIEYLEDYNLYGSNILISSVIDGDSFAITVNTYGLDILIEKFNFKTGHSVVYHYVVPYTVLATNGINPLSFYQIVRWVENNLSVTDITENVTIKKLIAHSNNILKSI